VNQSRFSTFRYCSKRAREKELDFVVVVTAPADVQRQRALARPGMTEKKLEKILSPSNTRQ